MVLIGGVAGNNGHWLVDAQVGQFKQWCWIFLFDGGTLILHSLTSPSREGLLNKLTKINKDNKSTMRKWILGKNTVQIHSKNHPHCLPDRSAVPTVYLCPWIIYTFFFCLSLHTVEASGTRSNSMVINRHYQYIQSFVLKDAGFF